MLKFYESHILIFGHSILLINFFKGKIFTVLLAHEQITSISQKESKELNNKPLGRDMLKKK